MKPRDVPAELAASRTELAAAKAKAADITAKLNAARAGDGAIASARPLLAELRVVLDDVENLTERVKIRESEHRDFIIAECKAQRSKDLTAAERLVQQVIVAELAKIEAASALAKSAKAADEAHEAMRRDWPAGSALPIADLSTVRAASDRRFRDAFSRPGARLPHLMEILGNNFGSQIGEACTATLEGLRAMPLDDDGASYTNHTKDAA